MHILWDTEYYVMITKLIYGLDITDFASYFIEISPLRSALCLQLHNPRGRDRQGDRSIVSP